MSHLIKLKRNSLQIATLLLSNEPLHVDLVRLRRVVPGLTEAGWRSLVRWGEQTGVWRRVRDTNSSALTLTNTGQRAVMAQIPALSDRMTQWRGEWAAVVFLKPPKSDPGFRFLRSLLLSQGAAQLQRGVYLVPFPLPIAIAGELELRYAANMVVWQLGAWQFGSVSAIVGSIASADEIATIYSSVSKRINSLLQKNDSTISLTDQSLLIVYQSFIEFFDALVEDGGYVSWLNPDIVSPRSVLRSIQSLLRL